MGWPQGDCPKDTRPCRDPLQARGPPESPCCGETEKESKTQRDGDRCEVRKEPNEKQWQERGKKKIATYSLNVPF